MEVCPLCNGFETVTIECSGCSSILEDQGKITDYFDDYSAYMDIDIMKLFDGDPQSLESKACLHYFYCANCQQEETRAMKG
ncbi:hypothetical protein [Oceanobacillus saliphilus]|uniref:hypothetical protein n=1 Tax=Oceanobacillus saliphilus TaxID=2925834 RepID=UPI00201E61E6|nr:hypothetical protein [Oceanobacillus saliphilus]